MLYRLLEALNKGPSTRQEQFLPKKLVLQQIRDAPNQKLETYSAVFKVWLFTGNDPIWVAKLPRTTGFASPVNAQP
jgi:hypothetical protein